MELKIFESEKFGKLRTVILDNDVWFIGKDVAEKLGYIDTKSALIDHVDIEDKSIFKSGDLPPLDFVIPNRGMTFINESGLYSLVLSSKLPTAKEFKRWITKDVIPSIRKYGMYATMDTIDKMLANPDSAIKMLTALKEEREAKEQAYKTIDMLTHTGKLYTTTEIAKELGYKSARVLNKKLSDEKIQFKQNNTWVLYSKYAGQGYVSIKQDLKEDGRIIYNRKWTGKGREFILNKLLTN